MALLLARRAAATSCRHSSVGVTVLRGAHTTEGTCEIEPVAAGGKVGDKGFSVGYKWRKGTRKAGTDASPWHDVPLYANKTLGTMHYINEIPRYTTAKMEVATGMARNPIVQDVNKNGTLRHYAGPLFWNYGCLPQTWEDPRIADQECGGVYGDNDPLDVVEIGSKTIAMGEVRVVKALGVLAMIDGGELDWKVLAIDVEDPLASELHDIPDVERLLHGTVSGIREWFRWYKTPDGKKLNAFAHGENALGRDKAYDVIATTHRHWEELVSSNPVPSDLWVRE